jgi:hypothetical protein
MIFVGIPCRTGSIHWSTVAGLMQVNAKCAREGLGVALDVVPGDAFIGRARNLIAYRFLETDATDLIFIDDDVGFKFDDFAKIMRPDVDICMGLYPMKAEKQKVPALMYDPLERHPSYPSLIKMQYGPTGFMRIKRRVFEKMKERWPDEWYEDENGKIHDFFPHGRTGNFFTGEDIWFCQRAIQCGFDLWAAQGTHLRHTGQKTWDIKWQLDIELPQPTAEAA